MNKAQTTKPEKKQEVIRNKKGQFVKGHSGNPEGEGAGRPKGSISIVNEAKRRLREDPKLLAAIVEDLLKNDKLRLELIRQIDGMPKQQTEISGKEGEPLVVKIVKFEEKKDGDNHTS